MSGFALIDVQRAIYDLLRADSVIISYVGTVGIWDYVPDNSPFPYVYIPEVVSTPSDDKTSDSMDNMFNIHTFDRNSLAKTSKTCKLVMQRVYELIHRQELTITNQSFVLARCEYNNVFLDADGLTWHGVQRFRIQTTE